MVPVVGTPDISKNGLKAAPRLFGLTRSPSCRESMGWSLNGELVIAAKLASRHRGSHLQQTG